MTTISHSWARSRCRPAADFFPEDLTREQFDAYVAAHPTQKTQLYDPFTIVQRKAELLETVPYHVAFKDFLDLMAQDLRDAADLSNDEDPAFAKFLRLRATALLNDDYFPSDLAWLDLENPKIDIVFAPYETYLDSLLGVKTSYGAAVMIRNEAESQKLAVFQKYVPDLQEALPLSAGGLAVEAREAIAHGSDGRRSIARAICFTATRPWPTICRTIPASTSRKAQRKSSGRISWTRA